MYYYLDGKLAFTDRSFVVIDCGGVGYKCNITSNTYKAISAMENVSLFTHLSVKEDALDLYGFWDRGELECFTMLISISGIGPKSAMAVLSELDPVEFLRAVATNDYKKLKVPGIGLKGAQRICLELKDKVSQKISELESEHLIDVVDEGMVLTDDDAKSEAVSALVVLGYNKNDAQNAVMKCSAENTSDLIRQALKLLSKN